MTIQNYLIIENNVVTNCAEWDGNTQIWTPPADSIQLIQSNVPAMLWQFNEDKTDYVLVEFIGYGDIGFTWDGTVLTTNEPQPAPVTQPTVNGTVAA